MWAYVPRSLQLYNPPARSVIRSLWVCAQVCRSKCRLRCPLSLSVLRLVRGRAVENALLGSNLQQSTSTQVFHPNRTDDARCTDAITAGPDRRGISRCRLIGRVHGCATHFPYAETVTCADEKSSTAAPRSHGGADHHECSCTRVEKQTR